MKKVVEMEKIIKVEMKMDMRMYLVMIVIGVIYVMIGKIVMRKKKDGKEEVEKNKKKILENVRDKIRNVQVVKRYKRIE